MPSRYYLPPFSWFTYSNISMPKCLPFFTVVSVLFFLAFALSDVQIAFQKCDCSPRDRGFNDRVLEFLVKTRDKTVDEAIWRNPRPQLTSKLVFTATPTSNASTPMRRCDAVIAIRIACYIACGRISIRRFKTQRNTIRSPNTVRMTPSWWLRRQINAVLLNPVILQYRIRAERLLELIPVLRKIKQRSSPLSDAAPLRDRWKRYRCQVRMLQEAPDPNLAYHQPPCRILEQARLLVLRVI